MTHDSGAADAWRLLATLTAGRRMAWLAALWLTMVAALAELAPFWLIYRAIALLVEAPQALGAALPGLAGWLALALVLKYLAYGGAYLLSHHGAYAVMAATRRRLAGHLAEAPLHWLYAQGAGALKQSVIQDVERMEAFLAHHTVEVGAAVLAPLCAAALLWWVDWRLALAVLATGPLAWLGAHWTLRGMGRDHDRFNRASARLDNATVEYVRNMPVMKVFCRAGEGFQLLRRRLHDYYRLTGRITRRTVPGWALFTSMLGAHVLLVLPLGAWLHGRGEAGAADVAAALLLGAGVFRPLLKVSRFFMEMPEIFAGLRRMAPILACRRPPRLPAPHSPPSSAPETLRLSGVGFGYGARAILADVSLTLRPGSFNVLVGPSGAGKTTLAQVVAGVLPPLAGEACIGGRPLAALDDAERARRVAFVTQEVFLFAGTIRDNLCLARPPAPPDDAALHTALRVAQAAELVAALPEGLDTELRELGTRLSGGERQRLAVARALLADTPLLVLDEATAFADSLTQRDFFRALRETYPRKTCLVVAHRLYGIERSDQVLVLEGGRLSGCGDHARLLREHAWYRGMWRCEAENDAWALRRGAEHGGAAHD
ncbi:ABC transporter ATP-binding protein [Thauera linaloolentis]|uniref:Poossible ABC-type transporter protein n=1 Tax=Thauera linaloolentis (strain DSM 12138 / JCM 21573 / CCUG 41526 / CIP 105981 / IAM 15112 / NBRC 102519 / 47Lol) TaxID=1123367 RepID=N6Z137_THAL4|nr:ABC transporter ATP-binding protein [Thauera linaloolentis]ENO88312.1 poossible ABC-type transporter protein [Thauera linaloolentis 47Lol = DSM 12138]MCM8564478.1 ABC transporter ATP-binding protein/permease [Thauera linaloolentis]